MNAATSPVGCAVVLSPHSHDLAVGGLDISDPNGHEAAVGELPRDRSLREEGDAEPLLHHLLRSVDVVELHDAARRHSRLAEERAREPVVARGAVEEDELRLRDLGDRDALCARRTDAKGR